VCLSPEKVEKTIESYKFELNDIRKPHSPIEFACNTFPHNIKNKKILIVGLGLSCGYVYDFLFKGAGEIFGIEPNISYLRIQKKHAKILGINPNNFSCDVAESLPFNDCTFDFIFCYTVIEHVQDVRKSLLEMHRVLNPGGVLYLEAPDYRIPQEPHYKLQFPLYFPLLNYFYSRLPSSLRKLIIRFTLIIQNKNTNFLNSINFLDEISLKQIFYSNGWSFFQHHFPPNLKYPKNILIRSLVKLGISRNISFFILK
jgi:SAM-dependent methyltransferase